MLIHCTHSHNNSNKISLIAMIGKSVLLFSDIDRTFPENIYFQSATSHDPNAKSQSLYNVLVCIAHQNRRIGYCQVGLDNSSNPCATGLCVYI